MSTKSSLHEMLWRDITITGMAEKIPSRIASQTAPICGSQKPIGTRTASDTLRVADENPGAEDQRAADHNLKRCATPGRFHIMVLNPRDRP